MRARVPTYVQSESLLSFATTDRGGRVAIHTFHSTEKELEPGYNMHTIPLPDLRYAAVGTFSCWNISGIELVENIIIAAIQVHMLYEH